MVILCNSKWNVYPHQSRSKAMKGSSSSCCPGPSKRKRGAVFSATHVNDRISQLPRPILHHILSFLVTKDVVRTGILSKTWYNTSTFFPISDFCQSLVGHLSGGRGGITREERNHIFIHFVRKSLQRQCLNYGIIPKFKLYMILYSSHTSTVEDCIQLAIQNDVKELDIKLTAIGVHFIMPQTLLFAKELIFLSLSGCHLSLPLTHDVPTWPFLRKLCLQHCHVDGQIIQNLAFSCPLLESLFLDFCDELPDISLSGLTKLTEVDIARKSDDAHDIMVELDVPSLKSFSLSDRGHCTVDLTACKNLTFLKCSYFSPMFSSTDLANLIAGLPVLKRFELCWGSDRIRFLSQRLEKLQLMAGELVETDLTDLIAGLPALKSLYLHCVLERINFSSQRLEKLYLFASNVVEINIDAPSLKTFACSNEVLSSDLFMGRSNLEEVSINFCRDTSSSLLQLRKFLVGFKKIKFLKLFGPMRLLPAESMDIPLPTLPDIKHLSFSFISGVGSHTQSALLNGFLSSCRPESISVNLWSYGRCMSKVFCEELSEMVKGQHCCIDDDRIQCGCHDLRSFQIKQSIGNGDAKFISCDALLELLPTADASNSNVEIHFMLEW